MGHGTARWYDARADVPQRASLAAGVSLGIFLFGLESDRLPALVYVSPSTSAPVLTALISIVLLSACTVLACLHPRRGGAAPMALPVAVAGLYSIGLVGAYCLAGIDPFESLQPLWRIMYSVCSPALVYFWVQRTMPLGRPFVLRSFGTACMVTGCLGILTLAFERMVASWFVAALPLAGVAVLSMAPAADGDDNGDGARRRSVLSVIADESRTRRALRPDAKTCDGRTQPGTIVLALAKLVPFLCYAVIFGNVHFSWLTLQGSSAASASIQLGTSVGTMLCGCAAFALARVRWGRALSSILSFILVFFALASLWLSTLSTASYVFVYLVLLNVAQKLSLLLMLLFGYSMMGNRRECASLWALAYYSFFLGTCVSSLTALGNAMAVLNLVAVIALAVIFVADLFDVVLLYGNAPDENTETPEAPSNLTPPACVACGKRGCAQAEAQADAAAQAERGATPQATDLSYTCHLIATEFDLTRREEEILELLAHGRTAARISETLCITVATARTHQRNIYDKLGVHSQQDILDLVERRSTR